MTTLECELKTWEQAHCTRLRSAVDARQGAFATLKGQKVLCFASNDYLGLNQHPAVIQASCEAIAEFGAGSGSSAMVAGFSSLHAKLETALANFFGFDRALVLPTGFMACQALLTSLLGPKDSLLADKHSHACVWQAARCARVPFKRFLHLDETSLARRLQQTQTSQRRAVMTEGVFSMDGLSPPLAKMQQLALEHNAWLVVDDAHGIGVIGKTGRGTLQAQSVPNEQVVMMGTFGKAMGTMGAFVAGDESLIESVLQFAKAYTYTTALAPSLVAGTIASLQVIQAEPQRLQRLRDNIHYFRKRASFYGLPCSDSYSAIQIVRVGSNARVMQLGQQLLQAGFWLGAIRPPTVAQGEARLRIGLSADHSTEQIDAMLSALAHAWSEGRT